VLLCPEPRRQHGLIFYFETELGTHADNVFRQWAILRRKWCEFKNSIPRSFLHGMNRDAAWRAIFTVLAYHFLKRFVIPWLPRGYSKNTWKIKSRLCGQKYSGSRNLLRRTILQLALYQCQIRGRRECPYRQKHIWLEGSRLRML
jgi:hypothetical protein